MRRYDVTRRKPIVDAIGRALVASGATLLGEVDPRTAPFVFRCRLPSGEEVELICYAFTANRYEQDGRPDGEHRFQVKYGTEFGADDYHTIYIDPKDPHRITLFFGVHIDERWPLFIAADPAMHNPTRFSVSVEFPEDELDTALEVGLHGWERRRSNARRVRKRPLAVNPEEVLIAFRPEHFLRFVELERVATGLAPGERLLLADKVKDQIASKRKRPTDLHSLEAILGLSADQILDVVQQRFRLFAAVRGGVAEHHLEQYLRSSVAGLSHIERLDQDEMPDFRFTYRKKSYLMECKTVLRKPNAAGLAIVDFQKTRASKGDPCSRYYRRDQFQLLAACMHPVRERWEFEFCWTSQLPAHGTCAGRLHHRVLVGHDMGFGSLQRALAQVQQ